MISFCRTLIFEVIAVLVLPVLFGAYGIWYAVITAEVFCIDAVCFFSWHATEKNMVISKKRRKELLWNQHLKDWDYIEGMIDSAYHEAAL